MDTAFWWRFSYFSGLLFLGFSLGIFAAWIGAKRSGTGESMGDILRLTAECIRLTTAKMAASVTTTMLVSALIFGGMCFWAGYGWRDHQILNQDGIYTNLEVTENAERANGWYRVMLRKTHKEFPIRLCPWTKAEFPIGTVFDEFKYDDRGWCYSLAGRNFGFNINMEATIENVQRRAGN